jgi:hypothetical protein
MVQIIFSESLSGASLLDLNVDKKSPRLKITGHCDNILEALGVVGIVLSDKMHPISPRPNPAP